MMKEIFLFVWLFICLYYFILLLECKRDYIKTKEKIRDPLINLDGLYGIRVEEVYGYGPMIGKVEKEIMESFQKSLKREITGFILACIAAILTGLSYLLSI